MKKHIKLPGHSLIAPELFSPGRSGIKKDNALLSVAITNLQNPIKNLVVINEHWFRVSFIKN
jgi:hypothetical protein